MQREDFDSFLEERFDHIRGVLASKGAEYVPEDLVEEEQSRFHNFYIAAAFNSETPERALWGMLTKHLVSLSDMVQSESTDTPLYIWEEKITDAVNYLLLLHAMVEWHSGGVVRSIGNSDQMAINLELTPTPPIHYNFSDAPHTEKYFPAGSNEN